MTLIEKKINVENTTVKNFNLDPNENLPVLIEISKQKKNNFWEEVKKYKDLYERKNKEKVELELEEVKTTKIAMSEIDPSYGDYMSSFLFVISLLALVMFNVQEYLLYITLPVFLMLIGKYIIPKKIKKINKKAVKEKELTLLIEDFSENFENEIANSEILQSFKENYGVENLEMLLIENLEENEKYHYANRKIDVTIKDLLNKATNIENHDENKRVAKEIAESI